MTPVLFIRADDLLKASHYKRITVPGHNHGGKWVSPYSKNVLVSDDHDTDKVAAGDGSFYQKQAHKKLVGLVDGFATMNPDAKASLIVAHATDMQKDASASAAVSGFKSSMLAGKEPTTAQYLAMQNAPTNVQSKIADACAAVIGEDKYMKLLWAASAKSNQTKGKTSEPQAKKTEQASSGQPQKAEVDPLAGPTVDTPVPAQAKKTMDGMFADGNVETLQAVADNNSANPHVAAYAQKLLDKLKSRADAGFVTLKDWPSSKFKLNADNQWEAHGLGISDGLVSVQGPELSAALFIKKRMQVPADVVAKLSDKSKAAIVKDAAAEFGMSTMDVQALLSANEKPAASAGPKDGDTKSGADGKNLVFKNGRWHKYVDADESGELPPVLVPVDDAADSHKAAVAAMETGAFYQKEAIKKLKAEHGDAWHAMHPTQQHDLAQAKYQALQGAASQAAAVSGWKKHMLAGQVPTPSEVKAFATMAMEDSAKAGKMLAEVQGKIGGDKLAVLVAQAHAKAVKAHGNVTMTPAQPAKVFVTEKPKAPAFGPNNPNVEFKSGAHVVAFDPTSGVWQYKNSEGYWEPVVNEPLIQHLNAGRDADGVALSPAAKPVTLADKPAYDHLAQSIANHKSHSLPAQKTFSKLAAQDWMAANPSKGSEMYEALAALKLSHLAAMVGPDVKPAEKPSGINEAKAKFENNPDVMQFITMFKLHGSKAMQDLPIDQLLDADDIAAFDKLTPDQKSDVAAAISFYGPHKLMLFSNWLADKNAKAAKPAGPVPVASQVFKNITPGHNKFWSVSTHGKVMKTTYGKIGTTGSTTTKEFSSPEAAIIAAGKLKDEKVSKGYKYDGNGTHVHEGGPTVTPSVPPIPAAPTSQKWNQASGGWVHQVSDGALSGAPSLSQDTKDGHTYYVAHTGDAFQVGIIDPDGHPVNHEDFDNPWDAAAQMGNYIDASSAEITHPSADDIQALNPAAGPKDGDTKMAMDGGTLVFKNGRWHKQGLVMPDFSDDKSVWGPRYADVAAKLKELFAAGGAKAIKPYIINHATGAISIKSGLVVGVGKLSMLSGGSAKPRHIKMHEFVVAMQAAGKGGKKPSFTTDASVIAAAKQGAAKPAQAASSPKVFVTAPPAKPGVTAIDGWAQTGPQKGSNPGGKFKDKNGQEWYCKFPASEDHAKNELLASKLYKAAGVDVPTLRLVEKDGKIGIASKIVDGVTKVGAGIKSAPGALEGFAVDAWLGNHDSVGTGYDNLLKTKDGKAIRIDVGGSLLYRAMGTPKGDSFGNSVDEIDNMRDPSKNQYGATVFAGITKEKLTESVALVLDVPDDVILQIVSKFGPGTDAQKAALAAKLIARKKDLANKYPAADLIVNPPKPDPRKLPVDASKLPKKLDFMNWKGAGSGLSGTAKINEVNQAAVDQIYASAMAGNFVDFKKLKFHIVNKSTGAVTEGSLFGDHPSQHVKDFYSTVMDYMEVVANPAAKKQKNWDVGDYSDINELSDGFKAHFYGVTVGAVPANQRLGFWISLGQADAAAEFMPAKVDYISAAGKAAGKNSVQNIPANLKKWMAAVKSSGSANTPYRDGKEIDNQGQSTRDVLVEAYKHSAELEEGTRITKNIDLPGPMMAQMLALAPGHVFQNPGSMCCSINKDWASFAGNARLKIIYAKGAKALYNIGVGSFNSEGEITTVPGQRFMLLETDKSSHPPEFTLLMLPPDETYVANIKPKA